MPSVDRAGRRRDRHRIKARRRRPVASRETDQRGRSGHGGPGREQRLTLGVGGHRIGPSPGRPCLPEKGEAGRNGSWDLQQGQVERRIVGSATRRAVAALKPWPEIVMRRQARTTCRLARTSPRRSTQRPLLHSAANAKAGGGPDSGRRSGDGSSSYAPTTRAHPGPGYPRRSRMTAAARRPPGLPKPRDDAVEDHVR